jgi:hypothetical protein
MIAVPHVVLRDVADDLASRARPGWFGLATLATLAVFGETAMFATMFGLLAIIGVVLAGRAVWELLAAMFTSRKG